MNWNQIVDDLGPRLYRHFCVRFSDEQADDLTQETLLRLYRKIEEGKLDLSKGNLAMFGFGIAHYVALESYRVTQTSSLDEIQDSAFDTHDLEQITITKDMANRVRRKIALLPPAEQQILALFVDQELTILEISKITQIPENTIKSHLFRAKKKLVQMTQQEAQS